MIKTINGWRGIFALIIVLSHVGMSQVMLMPAGLSFFFMISGFLLEFKHPFRNLDKPSYTKFARHSAAKLYPLHWFTLALLIVVLALLGQPFFDPVALPLNIALLQSWSFSFPIEFSYNPFTWFLSTILFCYLCFPLLSRYFMPLKMRRKVLIIAVIAIIEMVIYGFVDFKTRSSLGVFPPYRLVDFMIGMTLVPVYQRLKTVPVLAKSKNGTDAELVALAVLSATGLIYDTYQPIVEPWNDCFLWWTSAIVLIMVCLIYDKREGVIGKILASKPLQWLGDISFEIFMLQRVAALIYSYAIAPALGHVGIEQLGCDAYTLMPWLVLPLDILLAWLVNRIFTRPVRRLLSRF